MTTFPKLMVSFGPPSKIHSFSKEPNFVDRTEHYQLEMVWEDFTPKPRIIEKKDLTMIVFGNPRVLGEKDLNNLSNYLLSANGLNSGSLEKLDGEFLIFVYFKFLESLLVINDHFASLPFYYYAQYGRLVGAFNYNDLYLYEKQSGVVQLDTGAIFEKLWFQRLLGDKTLDLKAKYLLPGHTLVFKETPGIKRYWTPSFEKKGVCCVKSIAAQLKKHVNEALELKLAEGGEAGLLLSCGAHSRILLSLIDKPIPCYSLFESGNHPTNHRLKKLTKLAQVELHSLEADDSSFEECFFESLKQTANLYPMQMHLTHLAKLLEKEDKIFIHGAGLDSLFAGKDLPYRHRSILGYELPLKKLVKDYEHLIPFYLRYGANRYRTERLHDLLSSMFKEEVHKKMANSISEVLKLGLDSFKDQMDAFFYLNYHSVSRIGPFGSALSLASLPKSTALTFQNQTLDLLYRIPHSMRFDGKIIRACLKLKNEEFGKIKTDHRNTLLTSSWEKTIQEIKAFRIKKNVKLNLDTKFPLTSKSLYNERFLNSDFAKDLAKDLLESKPLENLEWLDKNKLKAKINGWLKSKREQNDPFLDSMILSFIQLDQFLKQEF